MKQIAQPHQYPLGRFADRQQAETAFKALQKAGFAVENLSVMPEALNPNPSLKNSEAARSAGGGAIAGTLFGGLVGLLFSFFALNLANPPDISPISGILSIVLLGSGIGAAGMGLMAAITGAGVSKAAHNPQTDKYLIVAEETPTADLERAKTVLRQQGSEL